MARLDTRKRGIVDVDELRAKRVAYGRPLGMSDYIRYSVTPGLLFGGLSFLIYYNGWVSAIILILGSVYGFMSYLPRTIRKEYERQGFAQRNKFLNNMTQVLTDEKQTVVMGLRKVIPRAGGEFKDVDLTRFHAQLLDADIPRIRQAVDALIDKYEDDIIFVQYMEQLETALIEGKTNIDTLKDIKSYHNDIRKKQDHYERQKLAHLKDMKKMMVVMLILIVSLTLSFGFDTYLSSVARHPVGYVSGGVFIGLMFFFYTQFSRYLFDDSVLEMRTSTKVKG